MGKPRRFHRTFDAEQRRDLRISVQIETVVCSSTVSRRAAVMTDISVEGCRIATPFGWREGSTLVVTMPTIAPQGAQVRWRSAEAIGLRFERRLSPLVVDHLIRRSSAG